MSEGISLGWNCHSAINGVALGFRNIKSNGYKTCPFDEMISNYKGINDDFEYFCDIKYLELIITKKYPLLKFNFVILDYDKYVFYDHLLLMKMMMR